MHRAPSLPDFVFDSWYAQAVADGADGRTDGSMAAGGVGSIDQCITRRFPHVAPMAGRLRPLRGLLWFLSTRRARRIVCTFAAPGLLTFLALEWLFHRGRPRVILVEFLRPKPARPVARLKEALHAAFCRRVFPSTVCAIQVMTDWEAGHYAGKYRLARSRFRCITFPMMLQPAALPVFRLRQDRIVFSSGRAACDWPTLFAAATGMAWRLVIVCSEQDRMTVERLNLNGCGSAVVMTEISADAHATLLAEATVCALVLREQEASTGQVRLARAIEAGIPVVATRVLGLEGYLEDGVTGIAVPPADPAALRTAINRLLDEPVLYQSLRAAAYEAMRSRTLAGYVGQIKTLAFQDA